MAWIPALITACTFHFLPFPARSRNRQGPSTCPERKATANQFIPHAGIQGCLFQVQSYCILFVHVRRRIYDSARQWRASPRLPYGGSPRPTPPHICVYMLAWQLGCASARAYTVDGPVLDLEVRVDLQQKC